MINQKLANNPLTTKTDLQAALTEIIKPLESYFDSSTVGIKFDSGGAWCPENTRKIEALLRPLWGIIPYLAGGGSGELFENYRLKIKNGTNPSSESYFGKIHDRDQLMVEMASIGVGLCLAKEYFWNGLATAEQENLYHWLYQINEFDMPPTNWLFFRLLVNLGFKQCHLDYPQAQIDEDLANLNLYYLANGWYFDGYENQIDYYIPFGFHFYGLLYAKITNDETDKYAQLFISRAQEFAHSFRHFFDDTGAAVPFGRSLTYRFAQSSFWGMLAFAEVETEYSLGELKFLAMQNLRYWFKQSIFSATGELTIGYNYRNLVMAEGYNAYGSPYWALKSFIMLALADDHPFWTVEEKVPLAENHVVIPEARAIMQRAENGNQVQMFTVGQHCEGHAHAESKYEKFVYSTVFGFSVSKARLFLGGGAFDNTLAISLDQTHYQMRYGVTDYQVKDDHLTSTWQPFNGVVIKSIIIPAFPYHIRIHEIETSSEIHLADGGFSIYCLGDFKSETTKTSVKATNEDQISTITDLTGNQLPQLVTTEPNTNLLYDRCAIPTLTTTLPAGRHLLAACILGDIKDDFAEIIEQHPVLVVMDDCYQVSCFGKEVRVRKGT